LEQGQGVVDVNGPGEPQVRNAHAGIAFRFFPSLTDAMFVLPLVFLFFKLNGARTMLGDGDTGWHLRTGEWILANGRVPDRDIFSFTKAGEPWYAWEWLWDVIFGWLHQNWGMAAVVLASSLVLALTFALLFRLRSRIHCRGGDAGGLRRLRPALAGAASSVHALVPGHPALDFGACAGGKDAAANLAASVVRALDQPARRLHRRHRRHPGLWSR
jgi:hypothetical protein